jgi:hypothetical protein
MTSKDGARLLLHTAITTGDVAHHHQASVIGGPGALGARAGRPATAASPRVVVSTTPKVVLYGAATVTAGFAALYLEPKPAACEACRGRYLACLCVTACLACGRFSALAKATRYPHPRARVVSHCAHCGLSEQEAAKFRSGAAAHIKAAAAHAAARRAVLGKPLAAAAFYLPTPMDLLRAPLSIATTVADPYHDNFPF